MLGESRHLSEPAAGQCPARASGKHARLGSGERLRRQMQRRTVAGPMPLHGPLAPVGDSRRPAIRHMCCQSHYRAFKQYFGRELTFVGNGQRSSSRCLSFPPSLASSSLQQAEFNQIVPPFNLTFRALAHAKLHPARLPSAHDKVQAALPVRQQR